MDPVIEVLIAEDDPVSRRLLTRTLEAWGYAVVVAHDGAEAWRLLQAPAAPLLAIIDWEMPELDGTEICRRLKAHPEKRYTYLIMLTSRDTVSDIVTAIEAGADDCVGKPFTPEELRVRLRAGQRIVEMHAELRRKASHDDLTGLFNRRIVLEMLDREYHRAQREQKPLAVALLDIDFFKHVNDRFGHLAGDTVLRGAAASITASIRATDWAGRYGGEEFLIVMPRCNAVASLVVAERVRRAIASMRTQAANQIIEITASIGVAASATAADPTPRALIARADAALYRAKQSGRDRVTLDRTDQAPTGDE